MSSQPVIIIGAGMTGLCLAQGLKKAGIPFEIYERDLAEDTEKGHGWALTVHWAMESLRHCLPADLFDRLDAIQVDPDQGRVDRGRFLFLNLKTGEPKYVIPPTKRMRLNRKLLRETLATGIDIHYGKTLSGFKLAANKSDGVEAIFTDGESVKGRILVGTDGRSSRTRRLLVGEELGRLRPIPVRSIGVTTVMEAHEIQPLLDVDPLLFQGSHPDTGVYQWFSLVSTPLVNGSLGSEKPFWVGQLIQSWKYRSDTDNVPVTNEDRLQRVKDHGEHFHPQLRDVLSGLPTDTKCQEITWGDWVPAEWNSYDGRLTLAGDAAHAMTSYRGEAFNHAITDAALLVAQLAPSWDEKSLTEPVARYEDEMRRRTFDAVLLSTQACLEAHDLDALHPDSPCVSKRAKVAKDIVMALPHAGRPMDSAIVGAGITA